MTKILLFIEIRVTSTLLRCPKTSEMHSSKEARWEQQEMDSYEAQDGLLLQPKTAYALLQVGTYYHAYSMLPLLSRLHHHENRLTHTLSQDPEHTRRLSFGCPVLDGTFGGGIPAEGINEVEMCTHIISITANLGSLEALSVKTANAGCWHGRIWKDADYVTASDTGPSEQCYSRDDESTHIYEEMHIANPRFCSSFFGEEPTHSSVFFALVISNTGPWQRVAWAVVGHSSCRQREHFPPDAFKRC